MRGAFSLIRLAGVVLLAAAGIAAGAPGDAAAHQNHSSSSRSVHAHAGHGAEAPVTDGSGPSDSFSQAAADAHRKSAPCSSDDGGGHILGCCTAICHAALPSATVDSAQGSLTQVAIRAAPTEVLVGLSARGTDRPPKRG